MPADPIHHRDNSIFPRPTNPAAEADFEAAGRQVEHVASASFCAINCKSDGAVRTYVDAGIAPATRRAYRADLAHYLTWGGTLPSSEEQIAAYLSDQASVLKVATLGRRLAAISVAHEAQAFPNPVRSPLVRAVMRGIRRSHGVAQRQAKPLLREDLFAVLAVMGDRPKDIRDRALLLIGFAGAFRRSELVGLNLADVDHVRQGLVITLPRSKTDREGEGRRIGVPFGRTRWCPVKALDDWIAIAEIVDGSIFRRVDRHGRILPDRMSGEAVCLVVRERASAAGYDPAGFSGHSLRAGLATSAAEAGVATWRIRRQTGHASDTMLSRYVRSGELFTDNAAGALL